MSDKIKQLVLRLVAKTREGKLNWHADASLPHHGVVTLHTMVGNTSLMLTLAQGLQVYHRGEWEPLCDDGPEYDALLEVTGLQQSADAELVALLDDILKST